MIIFVSLSRRQKTRRSSGSSLGQGRRLQRIVVGRGRRGRLAEVAGPARSRAPVIETLEVATATSRALRAVAVALGLGDATAGARAVGPDLAQRHGNRLALGAVVVDALKLETFAIATPVGAAVAFHLRAGCVLVKSLGPVQQQQKNDQEKKEKRPKKRFTFRARHTRQPIATEKE